MLRLCYLLFVLASVTCGARIDFDNTPNSGNEERLEELPNKEDPKQDNHLPIQHCIPSAMPPNPESQCCGVDSSISNFIFGGNATGIEQYPWLALIEYQDEKQRAVHRLCGGSLISARYVLTAAHCVTGENFKNITAVSVLLGEYDRMNEGPDCECRPGYEACTDGALRVPIESIISHADYTDHSNDIALIRLKHMAPFTKFIRPICLPSKDVTLDPPRDLMLYAAGWGAVMQKLRFSFRRTVINVYSDVKQHVELPYINNKECQSLFRNSSIQNKHTLTIGKGHICAGGSGKDACKGDSGGPLMYDNEGVVEAVGFVNFGLEMCGQDLPGVFTNVYEYHNWITGHIED